VIYSMSKRIVDNGKSGFVYIVDRSERYHSSWIGQGAFYPKIYIYRRRKDRSIVRVEGSVGSVGIMPTHAGAPGLAGVSLAVCSMHTIISQQVDTC